jgi:hypothetical protein
LINFGDHQYDLLTVFDAVNRGAAPRVLTRIDPEINFSTQQGSDPVAGTGLSTDFAVTPEGVTHHRAMERFHVRASDGRVLSGAAAFVEVWARLPGWRWAARAASLPGMMVLLELAYRMFLPVRPFISRLFGRIARARSVRDVA